VRALLQSPVTGKVIDYFGFRGDLGSFLPCARVDSRVRLCGRHDNAFDNVGSVIIVATLQG
jgi:hypothetical protein